MVYIQHHRECHLNIRLVAICATVVVLDQHQNPAALRICLDEGVATAEAVPHGVPNVPTLAHMAAAAEPGAPTEKSDPKDPCVVATDGTGVHPTAPHKVAAAATPYPQDRLDSASKQQMPLMCEVMSIQPMCCHPNFCDRVHCSY